MAEITKGVQDALKERSASGERWYAVLEGASTEAPLLPILYEYLPAPDWVALYQGTPYAPDLISHSPVLLGLEDPRQWVRDWETHFPDLPGCLIASTEPMARVISHLQTLLSVRRPTGRTEFFRFFDPRVGPAVHSALPPLQSARWQGPMSTWLWWNTDRLYLADNHDLPEAQWPHDEAWLVFDETLVAAVERSRSSNTTIREEAS